MNTHSSEIRAELLQIISDVIGADLSGIKDDLPVLEYVTSSLELVEGIRRVYERFGVLVPLREVLEGQATLSTLSVYLFEALKARESETATALKEQRKISLAPAQKHIGFLMRYSGGSSAAYNEPLVVRLKGMLYQPALQAAVEAVAERYEALKAALGEDTDALIIGAVGRVELAVTDCAPEYVNTRLAEIVDKPFVADERLFRAELLRLSSTEHVLVLVGHALVVDGEALINVLQEIADVYGPLSRGKATEAPPPAVQWTEYANQRTGEDHDPERLADEEYWKRTFAQGIPRLELPSDRPRPAVKSYEGARLVIQLDSDIDHRVRKWAKEQNTTPVAVMFSAFSALVHRLSGQTDIVIGVGNNSACANSGQRIIARTEEMLPVCSHYDATITFADLVRCQAASLAETYCHDRLSLAELIQALALPRDQSRSALFSAAFQVQTHGAPPAFDSLQLSFVTMPSVGARYDFELIVSSSEEDGTQLCCNYSTELFDADTIDRWIHAMIEFLKSGIESSEISTSLLAIMSDQERHRLLNEWNATQKTYPRDHTILDLFTEQADACPNAPAIRSRGEELTYAQLKRRVEKIAALLWAANVRPTHRVGVLLPRSADLIAAILATWRIGAIYVPLDRNFPKHRLAFMVKDAGAQMLITTKQTANILQGHTSVPQLCLDDSTQPVATTESLPNSDGSSSAYILYTSGSTGQPKGVEIAHNSLVNFMVASKEMLGFKATDSMLAITTISFDISFIELFLPLISGGMLMLAEEGLAGDGFRLAERIESRKPTYMQATASTWKAVVAAGWKGGKGLCIMSAGEALSRELGEQLLERGRVVLNLYGPTETTIYSAAHRVVSAPREAMQIGRPYPNTQLYIFDDQFQPVPIGAVGELYIGGDGLARGYWNRPDITSERFVPHPFSRGERLYRTGDLARYLSSGDVICLGRVDDQVKIHGVRVELGEVEAALRHVKGITDAVVTPWVDANGDTQLVAHVLSNNHLQPKSSEIRAELRERLPDAMIPPYFNFLDTFPLTANGKIHRAALPAPHAIQMEHRHGWTAPETPTERQLAGAWSRILGLEVDNIGRDDDFMDLGGHSLVMTQLMVEVNKLFHVSFSMADFFGASALRNFAALVDKLRRSRDAQLGSNYGILPVRGPEWGEQRMAFLAREAELPPSIAPVRGLTFQSPDKPRVALLTGATGFLGAYIVSQVLETTDAELHCLVRPRQGVNAKNRIADQMRNYELWRDDEQWQSTWNDRVHVIEGDVILSRLGMTDAAYESLARAVDCIIHSAAHVNFIYPYEALKATNVVGVHEIIRFAFHGRIKPVHYLSTAAVWPMGSEFTFYEQDSLEHGKLLNLGYDEAKWVSEKCLLHAAERGLPVARYRPGEVGGDSKSGRCVLSHFVIAALKGFLQYGAFPTIDTDLDVTPVDYVAKALVHMAFRANPLGRAFHLTNPQRCHITEAFAFLRELGYRFEELQWENLRSQLVYDNGFANNALFPYQAVLEAMDERSLQLPNYDCTETVKELEGSDIVCAPVDNQLLGTYMRYLREIGYMPGPAEMSVAATQAF